MSRDGATAGHDAAVIRSVYGHPAPFHLRGRSSSRGESKSRRVGTMARERRTSPRAGTVVPTTTSSTPTSMVSDAATAPWSAVGMANDYVADCFRCEEIVASYKHVG